MGEREAILEEENAQLRARVKELEQVTHQFRELSRQSPATQADRDSECAELIKSLESVVISIEGAADRLDRIKIPEPLSDDSDGEIR
jgi:hypothetical protein